jgi:hypothetical protein
MILPQSTSRYPFGKKYPSERGKVLFFDKQELDQWAKEFRINTLEESQQAAQAYCFNH